MGRRFHSLKRALKALRAVGAAPGAITPDAPDGSVLKHYQDYKAGKLHVVYTRTGTASNPGSEKFCSLTPFGLLGTEVKVYLTNISGRAIAGYSATGVDDAILGIDHTPTGTAGLVRVKGFRPARATVSVHSGAGVSTPSKLTGEDYKKRTNASYTYPFGSTGTHLSYNAAKNNLLLLVSTGTADRGISFKPEAI
ncbi:MAG: hypothetical protein V7K27_20010 [Nostoc sp.]|uniref:hypothetical protein n=1 Tax=Nostoc sp. TaxID=1180 RepID=UPI002FFA24A9